jgi:hypothetical protein
MTTATKTWIVRRSYYASVDGYWKSIESFRTPLGLPEWCFDFVSIHRSRDGKYSLMGPTCLIGDDCKRPSFEKHVLQTFDDAKVFAVNVASRHSTMTRKIHVVNCCS